MSASRRSFSRDSTATCASTAARSFSVESLSVDSCSRAVAFSSRLWVTSWCSARSCSNASWVICRVFSAASSLCARSSTPFSSSAQLASNLATWDRASYASVWVWPRASTFAASCCCRSASSVLDRWSELCHSRSSSSLPSSSLRVWSSCTSMCPTLALSSRFSRSRESCLSCRAETVPSRSSMSLSESLCAAKCCDSSERVCSSWARNSAMIDSLDWPSFSFPARSDCMLVSVIVSWSTSEDFLSLSSCCSLSWALSCRIWSLFASNLPSNIATCSWCFLIFRSCSDLYSMLSFSVADSLSTSADFCLNRSVRLANISSRS
mmetsp:Transcript_41089/g.86965  ORF Transcript_41089/g.86965 Transcript_41089/m.86965 type:complete len:322 (+) Transcript_41089:1518-2483(+)